MMSLQVMELEKLENGIVTIGINNPPANTLNPQVQADIKYIVEELGNDPEVRVIVFYSANPKIFMAGADLGQIGGTANREDGVKIVQDVFNQLERIAKPTVVAIDGHALGGGCEFALACDFRIMGGGSIGLTEITLGLIPGAGGTQRLTRLLGAAKATELILLGTRLKGQEAAAIGLVHRAVEPGKALEEAIAFAGKLAQGAVQTMGLAKQAILAADLPLEDGLKVEREAFAKVLTSGEAKEGLKAFFEKRAPNFLDVKPVESK